MAFPMGNQPEMEVSSWEYQLSMVDFPMSCFITRRYSHEHPELFVAEAPQKITVESPIIMPLKKNIIDHHDNL